MRSRLHLIFTFLITLFAVHQTYQLQQLKEPAIIEKPNEDTNTVIEVSRMNMLLAHVDNYVSVAMEDVPAENLEVSFGGKAVSKENGVFIIRPDKTGGHEITVNGINRQGEFCHFQRIFSVKRLPVEVRLSGKKRGKMGTGEMRAQRGLQAIVSKFGFDASMNVVGYHLSLFREEAAIQQVYNEGKMFTSATLKLVKQAETGDRYFFNDIKVNGPDGTIWDVEQDMLFEIR